MGIAYTAEALKKGPIFAAASLLHCAGCKIDSSKPVPSYFPQWVRKEDDKKIKKINLTK